GRGVEHGDGLLGQELVEAIDVLAAPDPERQVVKADPVAVEDGGPTLRRRRAEPDGHVAVRPSDVALVRYPPEPPLPQHLLAERNGTLEVVDGQIQVIDAESLDREHGPSPSWRRAAARVATVMLRFHI